MNSRPKRTGNQQVNAALHPAAARIPRLDEDHILTIRTDPDRNDDVFICMPATADCSATGAYCLDDGRELGAAEPITMN